MKNSIELRYISVFSFFLVVVVAGLFLSINKLQPLLFQQLFTSCTAVYQSITANSLIISSVLVVGLLTVFVSLSLKLVLSSHRTSQRLANLANKEHKRVPSRLLKVAAKLGIDKKHILITTHQQPLAITAGLLSPKIIISKGLIRQLSEKELEAVLLHELYHQQKKHGLLFVLAEAISAALSLFAPVLKDMIAHMKIDFENAADFYAVSEQGHKRYVARALTKLSGAPFPVYFPSFTSVIESRLDSISVNRPRSRSYNKGKLYFSIGTIMLLSFFASMPLDASKTVVYAEETKNVCVRKIDIGMSKFQNSSSILPASVF